MSLINKEIQINSTQHLFGNKTLVVVGVVVVLSVIFLWVSQRDFEIRNYPSQGETIIAFGDSLVVGIGAQQGNNFVSVLSRQIGEPIENFGKSGDTTERALGRIDTVLERNPKVVLVLLGGNDYIQRVSKEKVLTNLGLIIEAIQDRGAVVILLGVRGGILRDGYKKDFENLAREYETAYISNVLDGLIGNPEFMFDSIHPNDKGNQIIADRIYPVLKKLIK